MPILLIILDLLQEAHCFFLFGLSLCHPIGDMSKVKLWLTLFFLIKVHEHFGGSPFRARLVE